MRSFPVEIGNRRYIVVQHDDGVFEMPAELRVSGGTALKPAWEPIIVARKPLIGTVAANVLKHGTGGINIDGCRISVAADDSIHAKNPHTMGSIGDGGTGIYGAGVKTLYDPTQGRWPANVILDEEAAALLDEQTGVMKDGVAVQRNGGGQKIGTGRAYAGSEGLTRPDAGFGGSGGASRFFYTAKASRSERTHGGTVENKHPTVKPISLMRYLVRLVTPSGGSILDPFCGSGSTLVAAELEGFDYLGIEQDPESHKTACERLANAEVLRKKTDPKTTQVAEEGGAT